MSPDAQSDLPVEEALRLDSVPAPGAHLVLPSIVGCWNNPLAYPVQSLISPQQLRTLRKHVAGRAAEHGLTVDFRQSNHEGELIDWIQEARTSHAGVLINPAAYSHTSIAIRDALAAVDRPIAEVHISNVHRREAFRHHSHVSAVADVVIAGAGVQGYALAVDWLAAAVRR